MESPASILSHLHRRAPAAAVVAVAVITIATGAIDVVVIVV